MSRLRTLTISLLLSVSLLVKAQLTPEARQNVQLLAGNVLSGGITAGIGAVINKPADKKWHRNFLRGFWQGCAGGTLSFAGKSMTRLIQRDERPHWGWSSKIVHAAGTSIIYSAALRRPFLRDWNIDLGPFRLDFSTSENMKPRIRLMPWGLVSIAIAANYGHIDWYTTLSAGNLAFVADSLSAIHPLAAGVSFDHAIVLIRHRHFYSTLAHELVHIYQFRDYLVFNAWMEPFMAKARGRKWVDVAERYFYADLPWSRLFFILEVARVRKLDEVKCHYANYFEYEAEKLSGPGFVNRCR